MSIRLVALELYHLQQQVDKLERAVAAAPMEKRAPLEDKLRKAKAERNRLRKILDGRKSEPACRKPR